MEASLPENLLVVGRIVRTHGLNGECKVIPESDDPDRLRNLKKVWLGKTPETAQSYNVEKARLQTSKRGTLILMQFAGIHTINDAEDLGKLTVYARTEDLPSLQPGEFFLHDIIGFTVLTEEGETVGTLKDVWDAQSYCLYVVERPAEKDVIIPAVSAFITSTDLIQKCIVIRTLEGLLD